MNDHKFSPEIEKELLDSAIAERADVSFVLKLTADEITALKEEYKNYLADVTATFPPKDDPEYDKKIADIIVARYDQTARDMIARVHAASFVEWCRRSDDEFPGLGDALIAGYLSLTDSTGTSTFQRETCRPIIWKFQEDKKIADHAEARRIAAEKFEKRIAAANARGMKLCDRCGGAGGWKGWPGYTCYKCNGNGFVPMTDREKKAYAKSIAAIAAK